MMLTAIKTLEIALKDVPAERTDPPREHLAADQLRFDLMEMAATIAQTKLDIAAIAPKSGENGRISTVASELDSIVTATETATYEILQGAEGVQEVAWTMRQKDIDAALSRDLEARATEIFSACEFQDLTGQRIVKVVQVLNYIEQRLNSMINTGGGETLIAQAAAAPDLSGAASTLQADATISQYDVDELMWTDTGCGSDNALEGAVARLQQLSFHSGPDSADLGSAETKAPAAETARSAAPARKDLAELSQDLRTLPFC